MIEKILYQCERCETVHDKEIAVFDCANSGCKSDACDECFVSCGSCGDRFCEDCIEACAVCGNDVCVNCVVDCVNCGARACPDCETDGTCEQCDEEEEEGE